MSNSPNSKLNRKKKKIVQDWLQLLVDSDQLDYPIHQMNSTEWFKLFQQHHENYDEETIFSDARFFSLQMNNIIEHESFPYLRKKKRTIPYSVLYIIDQDDDCDRE